MRPFAAGWWQRADQKPEDVEEYAGPANRRMRRAMGFRGPAFKHPGGIAVPRYIRRHYLPNLFALTEYPNYEPVGPGVFNRRQRKARARIQRLTAQKGLLDQ